MNIKLYQTYFNDETKKHLDDQFIPYFNAKCTKCFADQIIIDMHDANLMKESDYFGVFSWRAKHKMTWQNDFRGFINNNPGYDYYYVSFNVPAGFPQHAWVHCNHCHGSQCSIWTERILEEIGFPKYKLLDMPIPLAVFSYQICKTDFYKEYVTKCLKPFVEFMEQSNTPGMKAWLYENAHYDREQPLSDKRLIEIFGVAHYTKHVFLTERLFSTYATIMNKNGKIIAEGHAT